MAHGRNEEVLEKAMVLLQVSLLLSPTRKDLMTLGLLSPRAT